MRRFEYFLYENFNADLQASNPDNPRLIFGKDSDFFFLKSPITPQVPIKSATALHMKNFLSPK